MKAIVLTFDKYRALTDHMIFKYQRFWPDHPFSFRVPYQELPPTFTTARVEYRKSPQNIRATVLTLLEDLPDDEWIYWCIDDKYPIHLNLSRIKKIVGWLATNDLAEVSGVLFCRCRRMWDDNCLTGEVLVDPAGDHYLERKHYQQIWVHQFLRVKVIRHLFESFPEVIPFPRYMDELRDKVAKPASHRLYVSRQNLAAFGESTEREMLTLNCYRSLRAYGLVLPTWSTETTRKEYLLGTRLLNWQYRLRFFINRYTG